MSQLKKFLLFCSGVDQNILEKCPSDVNKYAGIGATVLFTGILAFFSAGYALFTVFDSWWAAVVFGLVWGLMIFNLDRYIVLSMKSYGSWWRDFGVALPRLALAVFLAIVISKPLELKIFDKEIEAQLIQMEQEVFKKQEDRVKDRYEIQVADYQSQIAAMKAEIAEKTISRDTLALMALQEADGTGGSKKKNLGPIYRAKKADADNAQQELDNLLAANLPSIQEKEKAIKNIEIAIAAEIAAFDRKKYNGMAARIEALEQLTMNSQAVFFANIFIMLLFISIETAPIFVKLISYRSPYDFLLHEHEHEFKMTNLEKTTLLSNAVKNKLQYDTEVGTYLNNAKIAAEKEIIDHHVKKKVEQLKEQSINWGDSLLGKSML
jgi:Domain of unknown function (DUF4407)